jgi:uncharacterized surface protein with fasciclin (FAS1) repeats
MLHLKNNLPYILMAGGGIILAGIIAVMLLIFRPEGSSSPQENAKQQEPQRAEQTITGQEGELDTTLPSRNADVFSDSPVFDSTTALKVLINDAGLSEQLQGEGPFTFFAPNNDALATLPDEELAELKKPENREALAALITYHIVPGDLKLEDFTDGENVKTLEGGIVQISVEDDTYILNDNATVLERNIDIENGIVHIIDGVLVPDAPAENEEGEGDEEMEDEDIETDSGEDEGTDDQNEE